MKKLIYIVGILLLVLSPSFGQNLVQNGSFENGTCPTFASQLDYVDFWNNPTLGTPEFYHQCAIQASFVKPPNVLVGCYQYPRTGDGYIGLFTYRSNIPEFREYAHTELVSPLEQGTCYYFEMYVNHAECNGILTDGIGVAFSNTAVDVNTTVVLPMTAVIEQPSGTLISDTLGWVKVSGNYTASGGEKFMVIGNFRDDNATTSTALNSNPNDPTASYVFIDDVSLSAVNFSIDLGSDTLLCEGENLELDPNAIADNYLWNDGSTNSTLIVDESGWYQVEAWVDGCLFSDDINVEFIPAPLIQWPSDTLLCSDSTLILHAGNSGDTYLWQDNSTGSSYLVDAEGLYSCQVTNACGTSEDSILVEMEKCYCNVFVPNSFTPNGDNLNDQVFTSVNCALDHFDFKVFNRWGEVVFSSTDPAKQWDGSSNGLRSQAGVYSFVLRYQFDNEIMQQQTGHITLID